MANVSLKIENRDENKNPRQLRADGILTGSLYGKGIDAKSIQMDAHSFKLAYRNNEEATWELTLGSEKFSAKIKELQVNYATNDFLNVEFGLV